MTANSAHKESAIGIKSSVANISRYVPSGIYFARAKVGSKLIRQSLKTDKLTVAQRGYLKSESVGTLQRIKANLRRSPSKAK